MNKEISEIIEKNLPAQVGAVLKETLAKAESDAAELKECKTTIKLISEQNLKTEGQLRDHNKIDTREASVTVREKAVEKKEVMQEVDVLKIKLEESEKRADIVTDFTKGLVRNTIYRKSILDSENQEGYPDANGNMVYPTPTNKSLTETKEEE